MTHALLDRLAPGPSSAPRATCSSSSGAATCRRARSSPRSCSSTRRRSTELHREFVHAGLGRRRGVHLLRPPREAAASIGREHLLEPINRQALEHRRRRRARDRDAARGQRLQHERLRRRRVARRRPRDVRRAGRLGGRGGGRLRHRRDVLSGRARRWSRPRSSRRRAARGRHAGDPPGPASRARAGRRPRRAAGSQTPAPTSSGSTASAGRGRCCRCSRRSARRSTFHVAALPVPYRTHAAEPTLPVAARPAWRPDGRPFPIALDPFTCTRYESPRFARDALALGVALPRRSAAAPRRTTSARWPRRSAAGRRRAGTRPTCPSTPTSAPTRACSPENLAFAERL